MICFFFLGAAFFAAGLAGLAALTGRLAFAGLALLRAAFFGAARFVLLFLALLFLTLRDDAAAARLTDFFAFFAFDFFPLDFFALAMDHSVRWEIELMRVGGNGRAI